MVGSKRPWHVLLMLLVVACNADRDSDSGGRGETFSELRCGSTSVCAMTTDGEIVCWGDGISLPPFSGELPSSPLEFDLRTSLCALDADGELYCGSKENEVFDGGLVDFALGSNTDACALDVDGGARCSSFRCRDVTVPATAFEQIVRASEAYACGLDAAGELTCWGQFPESGCEDDGDVCSCQWSEPQVVGSGYTTLARGVGACGITAGGAITCAWYPEFTPFSSSFVYVDAHLLVCGVSEDGTGECLTTRDLPDLEEVPEGPLAQICSGTYGVCGLTVAGEVVCTGLAADYERLAL